MQPTPVPLDQVDLTDLDVLRATTRPGACSTRCGARIRCTGTRSPTAARGFWSVTRYDDIEMVDKDGETFTSTKFVNLEEPPEEFQDLRRSILETDGTRHQALRKLLARDFSLGPAPSLRGLPARPGPRDRRRPPCQQEEIDFVDAIAADFPIDVLARLLDAPDEMIPAADHVGQRDRRLLRPRARPTCSSTARRPRQYRHLPFRSPVSLGDLRVRPQARAAERKGGDGDDLVSKLVNRIPEDGDPAPDPSTSTTTSCCSSSPATRRPGRPSATVDEGAHRQPRPDAVAASRTRTRSQIAVEEFIRYASPVYHFRRTATKDVELHGKTIKEGDKVVMWFASGNRDDDQVRRPLRARPRPVPERPHDVRQGPAHLPRRQPGPSRDADPVRDPAARGSPRSSRPATSSACAATSSTASSASPSASTLEVAAMTETRTTAPRVRERPRRRVGRARSPRASSPLTLADTRRATALPPWTPGAHVDLVLGTTWSAQYSLCGAPADAHVVTVGVLRELESAWRLGVRPRARWPRAARVRVRGPRNHFPLVASPRYVFIAGGIGITPDAADDRRGRGRRAPTGTCCYGGRTAASMAFADRLATAYGDRVTLVPCDERGRARPRDDPRPPAAPTPWSTAAGPRGCSRRSRTCCTASWPAGALHLERFAAKATEAPAEGERSFELELAGLGRDPQVPPTSPSSTSSRTPASACSAPATRASAAPASRSCSKARSTTATRC